MYSPFDGSVVHAFTMGLLLWHWSNVARCFMSLITWFSQVYTIHETCRFSSIVKQWLL